MKRNNLTTAVLAGITGVAGIASVSNAVNQNPDGVGQVLIYPYYSVRNGLDTLLSVVNTSNSVKAVKVRFLEGKNSRECLDFNLYLSPFDVWTAALVAVKDADGNATNTMIRTVDTSCTAPAIDKQVFLPFAFTGAFDDKGGSSLERCTEGHFEIIEMGTVVNTAGNGNAATAATHTSSGSPAKCGTILSNWNPGSGAWIGNSSDGVNAPDAVGSLFGSASLVDVAEGLDVAYNADAIQGYTTSVNHTDPGNLLPDLNSGSEVNSIILHNGTPITSTWPTAVEAVSATYMHTNVYNEYALDTSINAKTEWVFTFPTKAFYVDPTGHIGPTAPHPPFTQAFGANGACEPYAVTGLFDREERSPSDPPGTVVPSPTPPGASPNIPVFCWETNVLKFAAAAAPKAGDGSILGSGNATTLTTGYPNGWMKLRFNQTASDTGSRTYTGLPVTGFAVQKYTNKNAKPGSLAQYGGLFPHKYRLVTS